MQLSTLIYAKTDGIAELCLNRPAARNAIDIPLREELRQVIDDLKSDASIRVVVLTGAGKSFCAGGDIKSMGEQESALAARARVMRISQLFYELAYLEVPVIAGVDGAATGAGLSLVLASDIVIATERATFGATFVRAGLAPDTGTTYFLPRIIGLGRARAMILTGDLVEAQEAERIGLVTRIVPHEKLADELRNLAAKLATSASRALGMAKIHMLRALDADLASANLIESYGNALLFDSSDHREARDAFIEKRPAKFTGK